MAQKFDLAALARAVVKAAGGPTKLGDALGISRQAVGKWTRVPIERIAEVEQASGMARESMRPDVFQREESHHAKRNAQGRRAVS